MNPEQLTPTHRAILTLYADGKRRRDVAAELGVPVASVKRLTREACQILEARNRTHAVAVAWRARVIL